MILEQNHGSLVTGFTRSDMASINQEMQDLQEMTRNARFTRNDKISKAYINRYLLNQKEAPCTQE